MRRRTLSVERKGVATQDASAVDSLQRGLEALRCFRPAEDVLGVQELARRLALPRSTTRRLLDTLASHGFLLPMPETDEYSLHASCLVVGHAVLAGSMLARTARAPLQQLADQFGLHALLCINEADEMRVLVHAAGHGAAAFRIGAGVALPLWDNAIGSAWLWAQSPQLQGEWVSRIRARSSSGSNSVARTYQAFHDVESSGTCTSAGEWRSGVAFMAAPVSLRDGSTVVLACARADAWGESARFDPACAGLLLQIARLVGDMRHGTRHSGRA